MADTVRYLLEEMVPELEDLEQRGYFSRSEIKQVVQKRQDFEYNLKRRAALKEDYLRYVEYETRLEQLRLHRRKERGITGKKTLADYCIPRRIHFIYERATRKFRGDLALWSRWLDFCQRTGSSRQMSRALTKALRLHPTAAGLWTYAAAWEFEHNLNASAARALMQRGLRMCKGDAPGLWHEYFRMELLYALRLRERRRVLGIDGAEAAANGDAGGGAQQEGEAEDEESTAAVAAVLNGAVAGVVYRSAIKAVPGSVPFRAKFLDILRPFDFPGRAALEDLVYSSVAEDFAGSPAAWDLRVRRGVDNAGAAGTGAAALEAAVQEAIATYQQALAAVPGAEMVALFAAFLREQLAAVLQEEGSAQGQARTTLQARGSALAVRLLELYSQATAAGSLSEGLALEWPKLHLRCGAPAAALDAARLAARALPHSAPVWQQLLALEACSAARGQLEQPSTLAEAGHGSGGASSSSSTDEEDGSGGAASEQGGSGWQLEGLVLEALRSVGPAEPAAAPLWLGGLQALVGVGGPLEGLCRLLVEAVSGQARGPLEGGLGAVAAALLAALERTRGLEAARGLYRQLLKLPAAGGEMMHTILDLELLAAQCGGAAGKPLKAQQLWELFEGAVDAYGAQDARLWLRYLEQEQQHGKGAGQVYWRAVKALDDPEPFIAECQLRQLQQ